ncbi:MAG TPA: methyltransferase domain-containing protein, partial [Acetobacteraceae bacterium]|nr:methyltransferase domain-containing protein [Acetobacteraceae bacterium]
LLPPIALPLVRRVVTRFRNGRPEWAVVREGWRDDDPRQGGWHHPSVVEAQRGRWPDFLAAVQGTGPLGVSHEARHIIQDNPGAHNAILCFLHAVSRAGFAASAKPLRVLDWGGGLGYYAAIARAALPELTLDYTVKEIRPVCEAGRALLPGVTFEAQEEAALARRYDLVFASNALQYSQHWAALLRRFAAAAPGRFVFLTRIPMVRNAADFVVVQRPHWAGYRTEYISWTFNRDTFLQEATQAGLVLEREFLMLDDPTVIPGSPEPIRNGSFLFRSTAGG